MPNHVANRLTIKGNAEALREIRTGCFTVHQNRIFEYVKEAAANPAHGMHEDAKKRIAYVEANPTYTEFDLGKIVPPPAFIQQENPAPSSCAAQAGRYWYKWNVKEWGTKWNAYETSIVTDVAEDATDDAELIFTFNTAWNTPRPVIEALAASFPELEFFHEFFDEGWCFAGTRTYKGGVTVNENEPELEQDRALWKQLCQDLKGYDLDESEEDED